MSVALICLPLLLLATVGAIGASGASAAEEEEQAWWEACEQLPSQEIEACFNEHNGESGPIEAEEAEAHKEAERHRREWRHKPTVTRQIARRFARRLMRESEFSIWTVDCHGGRINRIHWRCRVKIFYQCLRGRIRVTGIGIKDHRQWFRAIRGALRPCRIHV